MKAAKQTGTGTFDCVIFMRFPDDLQDPVPVLLILVCTTELMIDVHQYLGSARREATKLGNIPLAKLGRTLQTIFQWSSSVIVHITYNTPRLTCQLIRPVRATPLGFSNGFHLDPGLRTDR